MRCQRKWMSNSLYLTCHLCLGLLAGSQLFTTASADSTIADCDSFLFDTNSWDVDNDLTDQRNALIEFYHATGGQHWSSYVVTSSLRDSINGFDEYLVELGAMTSAAGFDISYLPIEYQEVVEAANALSANCTVQRTLQLINLLVKYPWNTASTNLTGTIPASLGQKLPDLQLVSLRDNPGLTGRFPDVLPLVAAKFQTLELRNTSLLQCNASHIEALANSANGTTVTVAGSVADTADETDCLPNFLRFCPAVSAASTGQECPSIAFDRPYAVYPSINQQIDNLIATYGPLFESVIGVASSFVTYAYTSNYSCPTDGTAGRILGPSIGQLVATVNVDSDFYSWVGCNCSTVNDERVYAIADNGTVSMTCVSSEFLQQAVPLAVYLAPTLIGSLAALAVILVAFLYWRRLAGDVASYKQLWHKRRQPPGTLKEGLAEQLGLVSKEVSIVMTDVQGSSRLWEWNQVVMTSALAMHDHLLRQLLYQHCGYEVATEGDAFTMAFHDPIDAIAWALNVQHRLLLLPWPAELLDHPECTKQSSAHGSGPAIFCGLRVRMAIHTGKPDSIQVHHVTRQIEYHGELMSLTEAIIGFPVGGQVLISGSTYQRIYGRLHTIGPLPPIAPPQGRSALGRAKSHRLSSQPKEAWKGLAGGETVGAPAEPGTARSTAGLLSPTSSTSFAPATPATHRLSTTQGSEPDNRGNLADGLTRWGSFTQEQLAAFGFQPGLKGGGLKALRHGVEQRKSLLGRFWRRDRLSAGQSARVWQRRWAPSQTDVDSMVRSSTPVSQPVSCMVVDMGAFNLVEFVKTLGMPAPGLSVTGGVHVLQILSDSLADRATVFAPLDGTNKIAHTFFDAPGAEAATFVESRQADLAPETKPYVTMVFCGPADYKALFALNAASAQEAMLQFQSCVRTTLLLCNGYECQEKDGLFMIAFDKPWAAVEWAITLQLAMLKVEWSPLLELYELTAEFKDETGHTLMKGLSAKVGIFPGHMAKICPHTSTGRADYFGPAVNRAARLLCAAKGGQVLVEETFMQHVVRHWQGSLTEADSTAAMQADAEFDQGGLNGMTANGAANPVTVRSHTTQFSDDGLKRSSPPQPLRLRKTTSRGERGGVAVWNPSLDPPRPPHADSVQETSTQRGYDDDGTSDSHPNATSNCSPRILTLAQTRSAESLGSSAASFLPAELQNTPANQPPHAASIQMAVNNCHMLQYRASRLVNASAPGTQKELEAISSEVISSESPSKTLGTGAARKGTMIAKKSFRSVLPAKLSSKVQPAFVTVTAGGRRRASLAWNEAFAAGKPFPVRKVPIEVMQVYPAELAGRMQLHDYQLNAGKATLVSQGHASCQYQTEINLLNVFELLMSTT
ncbi:TPA: hypothetical protein ACH3X1_003159 [Trebouxia sp. C0004]